MAKITRQKCRKEITCSGCGKTIEVGEEYLKGTPFHRKPICRCLKCGLMPYELSGSDFVLTVGNIANKWEDNYDISEDGIEEIKGELEELRDNCQDSLDNMPEQLQEAPTGELLQERIDMLEDVINELDSIDADSFLDDVDEEAREELEVDEDYEGEDLDDKKRELAEENLKDAISEALSGLEY